MRELTGVWCVNPFCLDLSLAVHLSNALPVEGCDFCLPRFLTGTFFLHAVTPWQLLPMFRHSYF